MTAADVSAGNRETVNSRRLIVETVLHVVVPLLVTIWGALTRAD